MSLYLCAFDGDEELAGVDVGTYSTFDEFRRIVAQLVWTGVAKGPVPVLLDHADSDGEWTVAELPVLQEELGRLRGHKPLARFEDTDGMPLVDSILALALVAEDHGVPITFQ